MGAQAGRGEALGGAVRSNSSFKEQTEGPRPVFWEGGPGQGVEAQAPGYQGKEVPGSIFVWCL